VTDFQSDVSAAARRSDRDVLAVDADPGVVLSGRSLQALHGVGELGVNPDAIHEDELFPFRVDLRIQLVAFLARVPLLATDEGGMHVADIQPFD
jgi:hypothetical protein